MSPDTRRRVMMAVVVLIVVAFVLSTAACTTTTNESGEQTNSEADALDASLYPDQMNQICAATTERIAELPPQPEPATPASAAEWSAGVAALLEEEAAAFDAITVGSDRRPDHRAFTVNTEQQAAAWTVLSELLRADVGGEELSAATTEIGALTLGRDELADTMGLTGCAAREITS